MGAVKVKHFGYQLCQCKNYISKLVSNRNESFLFDDSVLDADVLMLCICEWNI